MHEDNAQEEPNAMAYGLHTDSESQFNFIYISNSSKV